MDLINTVWAHLQSAEWPMIVLKVLLAAVAGGLVGAEREFHGRAAGLRTHMLVSVGAALTAMIGLYLTLTLNLGADATRIGAQVMSGVGFLGAGTILLKKSNSRITGLTTAAGLWATAAIGLSVGYGFYAGAFAAVLTVIFAFTLVSRMERFMNRKRQKMFVYLELDDVLAVQKTVQSLKEVFHSDEVYVTPPRSNAQGHVGIETLIRIPPKVSVEEKLQKLHALENVCFALQIN